MLTFPYSYNWQELTTTKWIKKERSQEYQSMDLEYVTGQINPVIREWSWKKTLTEKNKKMHNDYIPNILQMTAIDILVIYKCWCRIEGLL